MVSCCQHKKNHIFKCIQHCLGLFNNAVSAPGVRCENYDDSEIYDHYKNGWNLHDITTFTTVYNGFNQ
jgi:hypothetical protein